MEFQTLNIMKSTKKDEHCMKFMARLNEMRLSGELTDFTLVCEHVRIPVQKTVLAASSNYFRVMFNGRFIDDKHAEVELVDVDYNCLQNIIDYIYTGELKLGNCNAMDLLATAIYLQIENITESIVEHIKANLSIFNVMNVMAAAEKHNNLSLLEVTQMFIRSHFNLVILTEEFQQRATYAQIINILKNDKFHLCSTDAVAIGLDRWVDHQPLERKFHMKEFITHLHTVGMSSALLQEFEADWYGREVTEWIEKIEYNLHHLNWTVALVDRMGVTGEMCLADPNFNQLTVLPAQPSPAFAVSVCASDHAIFVQGGKRATPSDNRYYFDTANYTWSELAPMLMKRAHHSSVVADQKLYALGGSIGRATTNAVECFHLATEQSYLMEPMHDKRLAFTSVYYDGLIYVLGGENLQRSLRTFERYDPRVGSWHVLPNMQQVQGYCSCAAIDCQIFCAQGCGNYMEVYDLRMTTWRLVGAIYELEIYDMFSIKDKLYCSSASDISYFSPDDEQWVSMHTFNQNREWDATVPLFTVCPTNYGGGYN